MLSPPRYDLRAAAPADDEARGGRPKGPDNENDNESGSDGSGDEDEVEGDSDEHDIEGSELVAMLEEARIKHELKRAERKHAKLMVNHFRLKLRLRQVGEDIDAADEVCSRLREKLRRERSSFHVRRKRPRSQ